MKLASQAPGRKDQGGVSELLKVICPDRALPA